MSEIKGQLLGIVLVVAIFGAVAGVLLGAFKTLQRKLRQSQQFKKKRRLKLSNSIALLIYYISNF